MGQGIDDKLKTIPDIDANKGQNADDGERNKSRDEGVLDSGRALVVTQKGEKALRQTLKQVDLLQSAQEQLDMNGLSSGLEAIFR